MELEIDFSGVNDGEKLYECLKRHLRLASFCGKNSNAVIDCLRDLREVGDSLIDISLKEDEVLTLRLKHLPLSNRQVSTTFLEIVKVVNREFVERGESPVIALVFI